MTALFRYFLLLLAFFPGRMAGQEDHCTGPTFIQLYQDEDGRDVRLTSVVNYGDHGDLLVGGMASGQIVLARLDAEGEVYWQRSFGTGSESSELTLLNSLVIDPEGMIAGVASHFSANRQHALLFRYNPVTDRLLYVREAPFESDPTGLHLGSEGEYIVTGSLIGAPSPIFRRAYLQRFRRSDGAPLDGGHLFDLAGEETIFDLIDHPDGGYLAAGSVSIRGSAGSGRSSYLRLDRQGKAMRHQIGPVSDDRNARLYAFDVATSGEMTYLLQWGDLDRITGASNTSPILSAFGPDGTHRWTRSYDLTESSGEVGIELAVHAGGLLIYGYTLVGKRDVFLLQLELSGDVRWARQYLFPGNAQVYQRANQQLLVRPDRVVIAATYSFRNERAHEGLLLQLDAEGVPLAECVEVVTPATSVGPMEATWTDRPMTDTVSGDRWSDDTSLPPVAPRLAAFDDCDRPCAECSSLDFRTQALCPGDSARVAGSWRKQAGVYLDTLPSAVAGCDSIVATEVFLVGSLSATYSQLPDCGLAGGAIVVHPGGGLPPYRFRWSDGQAGGSRTDLEPGDYRVTVTDTTGCQSYTLPVTVQPGAASGLELISLPPTCPGGADGGIQLLPRGAGELRLLTDSVFHPDSLAGLSAGDYSFIVRLPGGCEVYREARVPPAEPLAVDLTGPQRSLLGDPATFTVTIAGGTAPLTFRWTADSTAGCLACPEFTLLSRRTGYVGVVVADGRGCQAADSTLHLVERRAPRIYLPTAFSPNGDGLNDRCVPGFGPEVATILAWRVFDRWGGLVWSYAGGEGDIWWGGNAGATEMGGAKPSGVYLYTLSVRLIDGTTATQTGDVTVVR